MRSITALILMGLLLFNWCGYRWIIYVIQQKADTTMEARLDKNDYDESDLVEIRLSINMPYQTESKNFERTDGEIEINGAHYKYVRRKIENGQLVLKCIPNRTKQQLESVKSDLLRIITDSGQEYGKKSTTPHAKLEKNSLNDYLIGQQSNFSTLYASPLTSSYNLYQQQRINNVPFSKPAQPPRA